MLQLFFEIKNQNIKRTDTFKPVARSQNYLYAHFDFLTNEWNNLTKTAIFKYNNDSKEMILDEDDNCLVPWEVIENEGDIYVSVFAGSLITVNQSRVHIYESGYSSDIESETEPTPSVYTQLLNKLDELEQNHNNIDGGLFTDWNQN